MKAYILHKPGPVSNLKLENIEVPDPRAKEVLIKHTAIGINFFDVSLRRGDYKIDKFPIILGLEGVGIIEQIGNDVKDFEIGERVCYATGGFGGYAEKRVINQNCLISAPDNLTDDQIAASLLKGLTAHTLITRVYNIAQAKRVLVHSAAGGVGQFLCNWISHYQKEIIGTIGLDEKLPIAKSAGCNHVINYRKDDLVQKMEEITNGLGVNIAYDGIGKDILHKTLSCIYPMGMCVNHGDASGITTDLDLNELFFSSLYFTKPTMALYKSIRSELILSALEVFKALSNGILRPDIKTFSFGDIPKIHKLMEEKKNTGHYIAKF
ncbi:quinone oxidoreductase [Rickettsiales bacterium]|nr:quinone oxidoreductase [Rickettsiales bacterium]